MSSYIKYIEADQLAAILMDNEKLTSLNLSIFDVRNESEYSDGHIVGSTNHPSTKWSNTTFVQSIVEDLNAGAHPKTVVMHCAYSQQRGPTCARILQNLLDELATASDAQHTNM